MRSSFHRLYRGSFHYFYLQQLLLFVSRQLSPSSFVIVFIVFIDFFVGRHAAIWKIDGFYVKGKLWKLIFDPYFILLFGIESKSLEIDRCLI
jgi:hypothetical protein